MKNKRLGFVIKTDKKTFFIIKQINNDIASRRFPSVRDKKG